MHALIACALLLAAAQAEGDQFIPEGGMSLEEAYGPMAEVDETIPWYERGLTRQARPDHFFDVRTKDNCTFPIEVYLVQDDTHSFSDNYKEMKDVQLKKMFDTISANHPGSTFGVGTHRDKPIWSLGEPQTDYCWMFRKPLSSNFTALYETYSELVSTGGGDAPEYQFGSIIAAAQSDAPGWCDPLASRLLVVSTDAQPHFEDDGFNKYGLKPYAGGFDEANPDQQCKEQYYPSPTQVMAHLSGRQAYTAFLIFDGEFNQGGKPIDAWKWFNSYIEQSSEFVANVQAGATDFWQKLSDAITAIEKAECHDHSTTRPPSSSSSTTVATTHPPSSSTTTVVPEGTTEVVSTHAPSSSTTTHAPSSSTTTHAPSSSTTTHAPSSSTTTVVPEGTTEAPPTHTTTTHPPTTMTTTQTTTTTPRPSSSTTTTEHECPPCPDQDDCPCPAVKIVLQHKPLHLKLEVNNTVVI